MLFDFFFNITVLTMCNKWNVIKWKLKKNQMFTISNKKQTITTNEILVILWIIIKLNKPITYQVL